MKKILLGVAGTLCAVALVFSIGAPAQASTLTSAQVQAIVGLLQSFGADASIVANVQATLTGQSGVSPSATYTTLPATTGHVCPQIDRTLNQGDSGSDVSDLQEYLGVSQTGYFGPMTAQAVASFQADEGLSQVGIVGPQTRAAFARRCGGGGGGGNVNFSASPTYGVAPLAVTFTITAEAGEYSVEFGDGQSTTVTLPAVQCFRAPCNTQTTTSHSYAAAGTYIAKLIYQPSFYCPPGAYCPMMMPAPKTVGTVTITVTDHATTGGAPSINGLDSPTSLSVGQSGTWTVHASAPSGTQLHYSVVWGDEGWGVTTNSAYSQANVQTSATFSHAYQNAGTYNPTFYVSNDYGSAQTSASVVVSGNTQTVTFSASPTSGTAPLAVSFSTNAQSGTITFGDGSTAPVEGYCTASYPATCGGTASHTYTAAGTYTAILSQHVGGSYGPEQQVGTVTITVSGTTVTPTFSASPTSGTAPLAVSFAAGNLGSNTSAYSVDFGDGSAHSSGSCSSSPGLGACIQGALFFNHTYAAAGTYTAQLVYQPPFVCNAPSGASCVQVMPASQVVGTATITVTGGTVSANFSASPTSGWAPLEVRFTATGLDSSASYFVEFGDGTSGNGSCSITSTSVCQLGTTYFNHTYTAGGVYTASLVKKGGICTVGSSTLFCGNPDQVVGTAIITVTSGWL